MSLDQQVRDRIESRAGWKLSAATFVSTLAVIAGTAVNYVAVAEPYAWIAIGSALGGVSRYWCSGLAARLISETFPWGTFIVNVLGSFVIGFFATLTGPGGIVYVASVPRQFVMIGFCGGFTTFSSFSLQTLNLMHDGEWVRAGANIGMSLLCCLIAVWAGYALATTLNSIKWV